MLKFKSLKCKYFISYFIIFISISAFAQYRISGTVYDAKNNVLSFANVTVFNEAGKQLITYSITDEDGKYILQLNKGIYLFKISFLGYKPASLKKNITKDETINFKLFEDTNNLDDVVIKIKSLDASNKNDTIKYNLKKLTNGNEETLKDVLNKLPGVEIDENGKIKANGKKIDKLLIDGKEFFGDEHQLATENITPEMIKGISLLNNYNDFSDLDENQNSGKSAMNIEIDDNYKGNIKGNFLIGGGGSSGNQKKYELNTNLFTFRKKTNIFFIGSINNIGNQTFTFYDYINFQGGIEKFLSDNTSSTTLSDDDIPSYLLPDNSVENKNEQFSALNFSYNPSNKFKLNTYFILDNTGVQNKKELKQTYITNEQITIRKFVDNNQNDFFVYNSFIDATYKPNKKTVFEYTLNYSPQNNETHNNDIYNIKYYKTSIDKKINSFSQVVNYKHKFGKTIFNTDIYHILKSNATQQNINSNQSYLDLLFSNNKFQTIQNINNTYLKYGLNTFIKRKIHKILSVKLKYSVFKSIENFKSIIQNNPQRNDVKLNIVENKIGINFFNKKKTLINYYIGMDVSFRYTNEFYNTNYFPHANLTLNISKSQQLSLSYNRSVDFPSAKKILVDKYIYNYQTFISNQNIKAYSNTKLDNYELNYHIFDLFSGTFASLYFDYTINKNVIATNTYYQNDYRINQFILGNPNREILSYLIVSKKFFKIPFKIKIKNSFSYSNYNNYINDLPLEYISARIKNEILISSNFKKSNFNFQIGYKREQNSISTNEQGMVNQLLINKPYLKLFYQYKRFNASINNSIEFYQTNNFNRHLIRINPKLEYKSKNKNWYFYIKGNDVLNMDKNFIIENSVLDNYIEESKIFIMSGYIISGLKYKF